uniref:Uncharacterized protein n=1 Tax=Lotus japonicus TaxID=34305 RepID=I3SFS6_LOTJA|nr:unknown [Lotus japonicus]
MTGASYPLSAYLLKSENTSRSDINWTLNSLIMIDGSAVMLQRNMISKLLKASAIKTGPLIRPAHQMITCCMKLIFSFCNLLILHIFIF